MPNQFFSPEGDIESYFADEYWLVDQYIGDTLYAWGDNIYGTVGDNTTLDRSTPTQESSRSTIWKQVDCGSAHVIATKTDGTLWTWGLGSTGELGDVSNQARSTPRQISLAANLITGWKQVSAGFAFSAAVRYDGTLWLWGRNDHGQLARNNIITSSFPVQEFTSSTNWKQVSCGTYHVAAIKTDGTLWAWGRDDRGQIGQNSTDGGVAGTNSRSTPRQISAGANRITTWKQVACSLVNTAAIGTDGSLWVWGDNFYGNQGDGTRQIRSTPRQISVGATGITGWKQVACATANGVAIRENGTLWVWGQNNYGQIGDNTNNGGVNGINSRSTPRQEFTASNNWKYVSADFYNISAVKNDGTLWSWGRNDQGQMGDNTIANRSTPRQEFSSSTNWKQVANGNYHTVAIKAGVELN
jgi:alpha-tubulin suppressor-like RCC1 family protein